LPIWFSLKEIIVISVWLAENQKAGCMLIPLCREMSRPDNVGIVILFHMER